MEDRGQKWYIDTLDGRGGLAFAAWRTSNLEDGVALLAQPTFYFSPPTFVPIPILSPATALAAERFGFQLGLFDEQGEVPFASTAEVAEFVRRIYIGSGRSDGADDGGPVPVVPPIGDPSGRGMDVDLPMGWLKTGAKRFIEYSGTTSRGEARLFSWNKEREGYDKYDDLTPLVRGAELSLIEMLARFPLSGGETELQTWEFAAARLAAFLVRIDLPRRLNGPQLTNACLSFLRSVQRRFGGPWPEEPLSSYPVQSALLVLLDSNIATWWFHRPYEFIVDYATPAAAFPAYEPLDDLAHYPISVDHASAIRAPDKHRSSVADALSAVLGSPGLIARTQGLDAIALFAAARIVSALTRPLNSFARLSLFEGPYARRDAHLNRLVAEAAQWLAKELPRFSFSPSVERLIESQP
jgi:hypothetical protein